MPDSASVYVILSCAGLLLGAAGCHFLATVLDASGRIRLHHWAEEAGGRLLGLYERSQRLNALRTLLRLAPLAGVTAVLVIADRLRLGSSIVWSFVAALALSLFAAEILGRVAVIRDSELTLRRLTGMYRFAQLVLAPILPLVAAVYAAVAIDPGDSDEEDEASDGEIEAFLTVGAAEGILEPEDEDMIQRVIDFGDARVRSVMTPRIDMICAPAASSLEELAALFIESRHSRLPIYRESVDEIVGVLHIRDLFEAVRGGRAAATESIALKPYFVPETKPLVRLLREFQTQRQQIAIVVDEFGGTAGLVTIEDLLEEIVGDIVDEYEIEVFETEPLADGRWRVAGKTDLDAVGDLFALDLDDEPYETVGGMIFGWLGSVPEQGTVVEGRGLRLTVEGVVDRRIRSVTVERLGSEDVS